MRSQHLRAASIGYDTAHSGVPWVSCLGEHVVADRMVQLARRYNIPVIENAELAAALCALPLDASIPPELFEPVALVLAELMRENPR